MSKAILIALVLGIGAGVVMPEGVSGFLDTASSYMLLILLFSVGIDMGVNREVFGQIRRMGLRILVIPLGVILGSLAGGAVCAMILRMDVKEGLAITSGLGWYSLSGILMTEAGNPIGGTISFLSNVFREVLTFLLVPVLNAGCRPLDHQDHRIRRKAQSFIHRWKPVCIQYMMSMLVSGPDKAGLHVSISKN